MSDSRDVLRKLWEGTALFHKTWGKYPPDIEETLMVFEEESGEFAHAASNEDNTDTALEAADCIVTIMGVCMARGITLTELERAMGQVAEKNAAKTTETHYRHPITGKVTRKGVL